MNFEARKEAIRRSWARSEKAGDMNVFELGQFLIALYDAKTLEELAELENRWSKLDSIEQLC